MKGNRLIRKDYIVSFALLMCLLAPISLVDPAIGQENVLIQESEPMLNLEVLTENSSQPYIAGYMTTDWIEGNPGKDRASALRVTVSFAGTDKSVIQNDNFLAAGIAVQGPDKVHGGCNAIDWGYTFVLMVAPGSYPEPFIHATVHESHEWVNCLPGWSKCVSSWYGYIAGLTIGSSMTLTMEWGVDTLDYYAKVGETTYSLYSYVPNETAHHYFKIGTEGREWGYVPLPGTVKFFQFPGAWSEYNIGQVGWRSKISFPAFIRKGETSWTDVPFAYSTDGDNAYMDHTCGWGGDPYGNVNANYYYRDPTIWPCEQVYFYPTCPNVAFTFQPDTLLWDPNATPPGGGSGGGCPYVSTWNGTRYVVDNNLLGDSEASGGADVEDYYKLEQELVPKYDGYWLSWYSLQIREFENEHSYIDRVRLMAVDHESDVHVAASPTGEILTYRNPYAPVSATDNYGNSQLDLVRAVDGEYYEGQPDEYIVLDFGNLDISNGAKLVFRANYEFKKELCIHVQILDATEGWVDIVAVRTRVHWSTGIVDLFKYLPDADGELKVRLYFTANHKLDYVGLDISKREDFDVHYASLVSVVHSEEGSVKAELSESDGVYAELVPGQQVKLLFTLPENSKGVRTYIIYVKGHYYTIR